MMIFKDLTPISHACEPAKLRPWRSGTAAAAMAATWDPFLSISPEKTPTKAA